MFLLIGECVEEGTDSRYPMAICYTFPLNSHVFLGNTYVLERSFQVSDSIFATKKMSEMIVQNCQLLKYSTDFPGKEEKVSYFSQYILLRRSHMLHSLTPYYSFSTFHEDLYLIRFAVVFVVEPKRKDLFAQTHQTFDNVVGRGGWDDDDNVMIYVSFSLSHSHGMLYPSTSTWQEHHMLNYAAVKGRVCLEDCLCSQFHPRNQHCVSLYLLLSLQFIFFIHRRHFK